MPTRTVVRLRTRLMNQKTLTRIADAAGKTGLSKGVGEESWWSWFGYQAWLQCVRANQSWCRLDLVEGPYRIPQGKSLRQRRIDQP